MYILITRNVFWQLFKSEHPEAIRRAETSRSKKDGSANCRASGLRRMAKENKKAPVRKAARPRPEDAEG
jgi:hypothetical protein